MEGKIKVMNSSGFGFIETKQGIDFFFHYSACNFSWKKLLTRYVSGEELFVMFDNDPTTDSGPRAIKVELKE